eukprot:scpid102834/ scgid7454/ 
MQPFQGSGATSNLGRRKASDSSWAGKDAECNAIFPGRHGGEPYDDAVDDAKERLLPQSLPIPPHQEEVARQLTQRQDKRRSVCVDQQTTQLERLFRKCDQSWDKVLLHVVDHMLRTDSTDLKFALNVLLHTHLANTSAVGENNNTALHWAAREGNLGVAEILLRAGAKTTARNNDGDIPVV